MLGIRLTALRKRRKLTQKEVADFLGVTRPAYTAYEKGNRNPDYDTLIRLANYYEVSLDYLLGRNDNQNTAVEDEISFLDFINDPELQMWYKDLPKNDDEELRRLRDVWEIIKKDKK